MRVRRLTRELWERHVEAFYAKLLDCYNGYRWVREHPELRDSMTYLVEESLAYALTRYDGSHDVAFITYARRTMEGRVRHFVRQATERGRMSFVDTMASAKMQRMVDYPIAPETSLVYEEVMSVLDPREREVMFSVVAEERNITDVAAALGVTRDTVYRIKRSALGKIKAKFPEACLA